MLKDICQIGLKKVFITRKMKNTVPLTYVFNDLNGEEFIGTFYEQELQKINQKNLELKKYLKEKVIS